MNTGLMQNTQRELVQKSYEAAEIDNKYRYKKGYTDATSEYIYPNQKEDAQYIVNSFYNGKHVVSIMKRTKIGMDGLMIELEYRMCTHPDDEFIRDMENVIILTGMNNARWERDFKNKLPSCFKGRVFHNGQLSKVNLKSVSKGLIIIDEIDTGGECKQRLDKLLKHAGILDVEYLRKKDIRLVVVSATIVQQLCELYRWCNKDDNLYEAYTMTTPSSYIGHGDFLRMGIIQEWFPIKTQKDVEDWIQADIVDMYGSDYRVHFIRGNKKNISIIRDACISKQIAYRHLDSENEIETEEELNEYFNGDRHVVFIIKGYYRRANLIPTKLKLKIGAWLELYKPDKKVNNNEAIQAGPGRMTGYWREHIENGHKVGPIRTSIKAVEEYEEFFVLPLGKAIYQGRNFRITRDGITSKNCMLAAENIDNLVPGEYPPVAIYGSTKDGNFEGGWSSVHTDTDTLKREYKTTLKCPCKLQFDRELNEDGFMLCSTTSKPRVLSARDIDDAKYESITSRLELKEIKEGALRSRLFVYYEDTTDNSSVRYIYKWARRKTPRHACCN